MTDACINTVTGDGESGKSAIMQPGSQVPLVDPQQTGNVRRAAVSPSGFTPSLGPILALLVYLSSP
jgi:hypothetical protein